MPLALLGRPMLRKVTGALRADPVPQPAPMPMGRLRGAREHKPLVVVPSLLGVEQKLCTPTPLLLGRGAKLIQIMVERLAGPVSALVTKGTRMGIKLVIAGLTVLKLTPTGVSALAPKTLVLLGRKWLGPSCGP